MVTFSLLFQHEDSLLAFLLPIPLLDTLSLLWKIFPGLHYLISILLALLSLLFGGNFAGAKNQVSSAPLGDPCAFAVQISVGEVFHRQDAKGEKAFKACLETFPKSARDFRSLPISAPLGDLCAFAVQISVEEVFHRQECQELGNSL